MNLKDILKSRNPALHGCLLDIEKFCRIIWKDRLLPWFTNHDCDHSEEIIYLLDQILKPLESDQKFLNDHELFILLASAYMHDIGMQSLKVNDISIENLTQVDYDRIRKRHAEESYRIILKKVMRVQDRDDFHLPPCIDDDYIHPIALVSKGHAVDFFEEVIEEFRVNPPSPKNRAVRADLLTALLMIADELDLHNKRVDFSKTALFNLSTHSQSHWFRHHYVDSVKIEDGTIKIVLMFPSNADEYKNLIKASIEHKLKDQIRRVNPIFKKAFPNWSLLDEAVNFQLLNDNACVKRELPAAILDELKSSLGGKHDTITEPAIRSGFCALYPRPSRIFTGRKNELLTFQKAFNVSSFISIEGLGGIGKTEFAAKCIQEFIPKDKISWFDCLPDSKIDALIDCSGYSDLLKGDDKTELAKYSGFIDLIDRDKRCIFLDNYQNVLDLSIKKFLEYSERYLSGAKFIFISRERPDVGIKISSITLKGLKDDSIKYAKKLIENYYAEITVNEIGLQALCDSLHGHPFAIELAMQLLSYGESPDNIVSKIVQSKNMGSELSSKLLDEIFNHPKSSEQEKRLMLNFSVFRSEIDKQAISAVLDETTSIEVLWKLIDKKMISYVNGMYATHPLVREFCYQRLENKKDVHLKAAECLMAETIVKFDPLKVEEISHHLSSGGYFERLADFISQTGELLILSGYTNSLKAMLEQVVKNNISRSEFLLLYGDIATIRGEWDEALMYFEKVFTYPDISERHLSEAYIKYGEILFRRGEMKQSQQYFEDAYASCKKNGYKKEEARSLNDIGLVYQIFGSLTLAETKLEEALLIRKSIEDKKGQCASLNNLGNLHYISGEFTKSLDAHNKCTALAREIGNKQVMAMSLSGIGHALREMGNDEQALAKYNESLAIGREVGDKQVIAVALSSIGSIYYKRNALQKGFEYHSDSLRIAEEIGYKDGIASATAGIGCVYTTRGKYKEALKLLEKSYKIAFETGDKGKMAGYLRSIGDIYKKMGKQEKALEKNNESLSIAKDMGFKYEIMVSNQHIGALLIELKNYKPALDNLLHSVAIGNQMHIETGESARYIFEIRKLIKSHEFKSLFMASHAALPADLQELITPDDYVLDKTIHLNTPKTGRNDPCICGSGKKYKKCCGK